MKVGTVMVVGLDSETGVHTGRDKNGGGDVRREEDATSMWCMV